MRFRRRLNVWYHFQVWRVSKSSSKHNLKIDIERCFQTWLNLAHARVHAPTKRSLNILFRTVKTTSCSLTDFHKNFIMWSYFLN
jgi:hypothetical protein